MSDVHVPNADILKRLVRVEDAAQEMRFVHLVKTDAQATGMAVLYREQQRLQQEISGFRAEVAVELEALQTEQARQGKELDVVRDELAAVRDEQAQQRQILVELSAALGRQGEVLAEVLKRLS